MSQQTYGEWMRSNPPIPNLTAVDWYYEQTVIQGKTNYAELLEQAKQIEKEQILNACIYTASGHSHVGLSDTTVEAEIELAEKYYNETYGKESDRS